MNKELELELNFFVNKELELEPKIFYEKGQIYCASVIIGNETVPGQNNICFYLKLRDLGGSNFRLLEHILTVSSSSSERSSTVYICLGVISSKYSASKLYFKYSF